jgi:hypothetical protein
MGSVLRANQVQFADPLQLSIDPAAMPRNDHSPEPSPAQRVRIIESNPAYAVIELTCSCGRTTQVRCDYAAAEAAAANETASKS